MANDENKLNEPASNPPEGLIFPCEFVIKAFGLDNEEFEISVLSSIRKFIPDLSETAIKTRKSKDNKYLALSISIQAESREQLDNLYRELSSNPSVLMVL